MEAKIDKILSEINEEIVTYNGRENLFDAGLMDSFQVIDLVVMLEEAFDIEIDAEDVIIENFANKDAIIGLVKRLADK